MNKEEFTKGEWKVWGDWLICQDGTPENPIATFEPLGFNQKEGFANAYLIAAAPEMYEMLQSLSEQDECQMFKYLINKLLAKARGEQ